eukprot:6459939-Alexandrium_andersonii.AAC.1
MGHVDKVASRASIHPGSTRRPWAVGRCLGPNAPSGCVLCNWPGPTKQAETLGFMIQEDCRAWWLGQGLSLIHISEPTRLALI